MRFGILGPLEVSTTDGRSVKVPELKVRTVLADLLAHDGRPVSADRLIDDLWEVSLPANPVGALQAKVSQLRRALDDAEPGSRDLVVSRSSGYQLVVAREAVDVRRFQNLTARARATVDLRTRADLLADALALWRGPALADFADAEFARPVIARLEEQRLLTLEEQAEARLKLGEHGPLVSELGDLVARYPLRERLRATHIRALYRAGRQSEALADYEDLRVHLAEELGVQPSPELAALHQAILEHDPGLAADLDDALTPSKQARTNLPAPLTDLIGRGTAIAQVLTRLRSERLVTLIGPGGVGKTRLALETSAQLTGSFPEGVWVVELTAIGRPNGREGAKFTLAQCGEAVSSVLGIRDDCAVTSGVLDTPTALVDRVAAALRTKNLLLILDNCEHIVDAVAELAELLLKAAPDLRILATSQEPLGLTGEVLWPVPPLSPPAPSADSSRSAVEASSAARLFIARATAVAPAFTLDADNAKAVATICRRLDGIPLALELAATRLRVLDVRELADRLDDRFRLLTSGNRGAPARQRTLRAMIDWSWELLTDAERTVLRRLAVYSDGCTLEAAETVCAGEGVQASDVLDLLARLVDRSLVVMAADTTATRYRLLESVAAYCMERLQEAGEFDRVSDRHGRYYARLAEHAEHHLCGHEQRQWLERLDAEAPNLRLALERATSREDADLALRLVNALGWYWFLRGRRGEALRSLTATLSLGNGAGASGARARAAAWKTGMRLLVADVIHGGEQATELRAEQAESALPPYQHIDDAAQRAGAQWFVAYAGWGTGDLATSVDNVRQALADFRAVGDRWGEAAALSTRATQSLLLHGDLDAALCDGEHSAQLFRELGDRWGLLQAMDAIGTVAEAAGDHERARRLHQEGACIAEDLGLWGELSVKLSQLGRMALLSGEYRQAEELHEQGRRLAIEQSDVRRREYAELGLALVARREGRLDVAENYLRTWVDWCRQVNGQPGLALTLAQLGFVAEQRGDAAHALALHLEGYEAARSTGDPRAIALALEGLAGAQALTGHLLHAAELLGCAAASRDAVGAPLPSAERSDVDRISAAVQRALGEEDFEAALGRAARLSYEECVSALANADHLWAGP
ncbi:BTAD domain-containing putative transcriptional regulator [Nocardiopsis rhodophaea]|uniref:BTAD domain-containing putative transcriptional regulator n=2 Tax=Nocardiopsis rhodophaea TaxID=280238 RepID=A0ABN2SIP7_9ACTN